MQAVPEAMLYKILLETQGAPFFPPITDRSAWDAANRHPLAALILGQAEKLKGHPIEPLPASLYLDYERTGRRKPYENPYNDRLERLAFFVLAECLQNEGRYLDDILDLVWATCEVSTWVAPAHQRANNEDLPDVENLYFDLRVAGTAINLAETDHLLGDRLPAVVRKRIRYECRRRVTDVYLRRANLRWLGADGHANNWNAVCNCGAIAVALYLEEDKHVQARVLAKALASLTAYLAGFDEDGCTSEGVSYWLYGFGHYGMLSHLIETRTEGRVDMLSGERYAKICRFPVQLEMSPGRFVNFSDADEVKVMAAGPCAYLARRCGVPELEALARRHLPLVMGQDRIRMEYLVRDLLWSDGRPGAQEGLLNTAYYQGYHWLVSRYDAADPGGLVLAAKGGHNQEMHNQNDVGQFIVHVNGESLILDLGRQVYTKGFFGPRRYETLECRSGGHCVPVVNGFEQGHGREFAATLIGTELDALGDSMELELSGAYPAEAGVESIRRTVALLREGPRGEVTLRDTFRFRQGEGEFECRVHTLARVESVAPGVVRLRGEKGAARLYYTGAEVEVEEILPQENQKWGPVLRRLRFVQRAQAGSIHLRVVPE